MIDATFIISNRSTLFEEAAAENSGTTDSDVSDLGQSIPSYPVYFPPIPGQCRVADRVLWNSIASVGRLGRAHSRPFLDFSLFGQETVDFRLHDLDAFLLTGCRHLSVFDKALNQQVLKLRNPCLLL